MYTCIKVLGYEYYHVAFEPCGPDDGSGAQAWCTPLPGEPCHPHLYFISLSFLLPLSVSLPFLDQAGLDLTDTCLSVPPGPVFHTCRGRGIFWTNVSAWRG